MTARTLRLVAVSIALAMQVTMVVIVGVLSDWCFCSVTGAPSPPTPPPYVMRFVDAAVLPAEWMPAGQPMPILFVHNLVAWSVAMLLLLHGLALAARVRIAPSGSVDGRRFWLADAERVRPLHMLLLGCVLIGLGAAGGAMVRHRWLADAERIFAATLAAASAGQPLPAEVEYFTMYEGSGDDYAQVTPEPRFVVTVDPRRSGEHFLDRFVAPYAYGGVVRFASGKQWDFDVFRGRDGWSIYVDGAR